MPKIVNKNIMKTKYHGTETKRDIQISKLRKQSQD